MECTAWKERTSALVDGELGDEDASSLFAHMGECGACRRFYRHLMLVREDLMHSARDYPSPQTTTADQERGMLANAHPVFKRRRRFARLQIPRALAVAAVVALLALGGSTTALMLERVTHVPEERFIYVVGLPTVEVEATYLINGTKGL